MALLESQKFYKDVDANKLAPIVLIFGDEPYLIHSSVEYLKARYVDLNSADFNFNQYYAADTEPTVIREVVETLPVFCEKRVVIIRNVQDFKESEWKELELLFTQPVDSTLLVLVGDKIDKRKKNYKNLIDAFSALECKKPYDNEIPRWINSFAQQYKIKLTTAAVHRLHRLVGNNLTELYAQMEKLFNYVGEGGTLDVSEVNFVVSNSKEDSIFDFTKAIGQRDRVQALEKIINLLDQGQSEVGIITMLSRHVHTLMTVRGGLDQGFGGTKLANLAKVSPYFIDEYIAQAKKWTLTQLEDSLVLLHETDKALKSSSQNSHIWLQNLVLKACELK